MRKNGFTLIELLAVIVILAIIALIAVPIVLNIIEDTKNSATLRSADFYLEAVELSIAKSILDGGKINGEYEVQQNGKICNVELESLCMNVEVSGDIPDLGSTIIITNGQIDAVSLKYDNKTVIKDGKSLVLKNSSSDGGNDDNNDDDYNDDDYNDDDYNDDGYGSSGGYDNGYESSGGYDNGYGSSGGYDNGYGSSGGYGYGSSGGYYNGY